MPTVTRRRRPREQSLPVPNTWGGRRAGAGRKPTGLRAGVPHRARPLHEPAHPIHLTLRAAPGLASLREAWALPAVDRATSPVVPAETWLLRVGWRRHGLISSTERPVW